MATITIKQMVFPKVDITQPVPQLPDPYAQTYFGGYDDGELYISYDGLTWSLASPTDIQLNVPRYNQVKGDTFWSTADSNGDLEDYRLLGKELYMMYDNSTPLFEGPTRDFTKEKNSEIVVFTTGVSLSPNQEVLLTAN